MRSIKLLEEQIEIYTQLTAEAETSRDQVRTKLDKAQAQFENYKGKLDGLFQILEAIKEDFETYQINESKIHKESDNNYISGVVKWFDAERGYGFIETTDGKQVFANFTRIITDGFKCLDEGNEVTFLVKEGQYDAEAFEIRRVTDK